MQNRRRSCAKALGPAFVLVLFIAVAIPAGAEASAPTSPPFTECPAVGHDTSCAALITIGANGAATVATDSSQGAFNGGTGDLVGILNNSNALVSSVALTGTGAFAFNGQGLCAVNPTPCFSKTEFGPTGYEGPGTSFSVTDSNDGSVGLSGGLSPGTDTYFSLASPFSVSSVTTEPDIALTVSSIAPTTGVSTGLSNIASFTDGSSLASTSDFTATINWGDGTTQSTGTVGQPGGAGNPYVVQGTHTYTTAGDYTISVTVTDNSLSLNTATATGSADVTDELSAAQATIPTQTAGTPFNGTVATFTDSNSSATTGDFTASIDWGDGSSSSSGGITQPPPGTTFDVGGSHTYSVSGSFTITVTISETDGPTVMVTDSVSVVSGVITCSGPNCGGTVSGNGQTDNVNTNSTTGTIVVSINANDGSLTCNDSYRHAANVTTITESGMPGTAKIDLKIKFPASQLVGPADAPIAVCFQASPGVEFLDLQGNEVNTGDLPICLSPGDGHRPLPCVFPMKHSGSKGNGGGPSVVEKVVIRADDPRAN